MRIRISRKFWDEVGTVEVDTYIDTIPSEIDRKAKTITFTNRDGAETDLDRDDEREAFVQCWYFPVKSGKAWVEIEIDEMAASYALRDTGALYQMRDVWADWGSHGFIRTADRVAKELRDEFPEVYQTQLERARKWREEFNKHLRSL